jgi:hypothetical protein
VILDSLHPFTCRADKSVVCARCSSSAWHTLACGEIENDKKLYIGFRHRRGHRPRLWHADGGSAAVVRAGCGANLSGPANCSSGFNPCLVGGYIELRIQSAPAGLWTVVQWQDRSGFWHDVEGWKGMLDERNLKVWWVAKPELGKGPFRWLVLSQNKVVATSETFYLPHADQTVSVEVSLVPCQSCV